MSVPIGALARASIDVFFNHLVGWDETETDTVVVRLDRSTRMYQLLASMYINIDECILDVNK